MADPPAEAATTPPAPADEVDVEALSNEEIDRLLDGQAVLLTPVLRSTKRDRMFELDISPCLRTDERV